jgi:glycosyltransferase involved in cell wall biosynthesis
MSTPEAVQRVCASIPELSATEVLAIPNGYDAADFKPSATPPEDETFRIVHTGYLHTELGLQQRQGARLRRLLGGTAVGVDFLTRSHVYLLRAVQQVLDEDASAEGMVEVCLAGVLSEADRREAEPYPFVRLPGYVPHDRTLDLVRGADLLFLPMHELPPGTRAGIVPGKTYEYLGSGRPILAAIPEGDARDLLTEAGGAIICPPSGVGCMAQGIRDQLALRRSGADPPRPRAEVVARYEYRALARRLGEVFDRAAG